MDDTTKKHANLHSPVLMDPTRGVIARLGEDAACGHLLSLGCTEIERNWHSGRFGEIDLIMRSKAGHIVFVEVKTRRIYKQPGFQDAGFDAINWKKRRKILIAAQTYMHRKRLTCGYRCDAVLVNYDELLRDSSGPLESTNFQLGGVNIVHIQSAFDSV